MKRRSFINSTVLGVASIGFQQHRSCSNLAAKESPSLYLLSSEGCGRATGYAEANKIISWGRKTHVHWLDSPDEGFRVMIKTYDHQNKSWSPSYVVGEGYDNHGGAALAVDSQGHLHMVYYPHHHEMRYRKSSRPNDASEWEEEIHFGERCTYPTLVCGKDDTLYFTCRRSYKDKKWQLEFWSKAPNKNWEGPIPIVESQHLAYAHFQESLTWSADHSTLHLLCRIHEKTDDNGYGRIQTVGYMKSQDFGKSWMDAKANPLILPVSSSSIDQIDKGGLDFDRILRVGSLAVSDQGRVFLVYSLQETDGSSFLVSIDQEGNKTTQVLNSFLPTEYKDWHLVMPGNICFNKKGELFIVAQIQNVGTNNIHKTWGHASNEVVLLHSKDQGQTFSFQLISAFNPDLPNWLPSIERPTGHNQIENQPFILFTSGNKGNNNLEKLSNEVYCCMG